MWSEAKLIGDDSSGQKKYVNVNRLTIKDYATGSDDAFDVSKSAIPID